MKRFLYLILAFSISYSSSHAQKFWTLEECIKYALDNNLQIKRQKLNSEIASTTYSQSKLEYIPSVSAGSSFSMGSGRALNTNSYQYANNTKQGSAYLSANLILFDGFLRSNTIQKTKFDLMSSLQSLEKAKNDISINIATYYLQVLYFQEILEVNKSQLDVTQQRVEKTKKLVEVGNSARGTLLEIQAQAAAEKVNVTNGQNNVNIGYLNLTQLLDLDSVANFQIYKPIGLNSDSLTIPASVLTIYNEAELRMPQIKGAEYNLESYKRSMNISKSRLYPQLSISGDLYTQYDLLSKIPVDPSNLDPNGPKKNYPFNDQLKDKFYKQFSVNLNIPIFNKLQARSNVSISKVRVLDAEIAYSQAKQVLYKEIQQAHAEALASYDNFNSRKEAVISTEEAFKYSQQKFDVGMISAVDFNIAKNNLTKAKSDLVQSKYEFIFKVKVLEFYTGSALSL